jgi:hypothetical protein
VAPALAHPQAISPRAARHPNQLHNAMKDERKAIAQWEEDQEFSILGTLELFSGDIQGYIETIALTPQTIPNSEALIHLRKLNAFQLDYFTAWYFENWKTYPQVHQYIEQLDHLRLLLIEHFDARVPVAA